ncbi:MAG TPA: CYCXC family (seleno)protein [Gemmatimonadales bacterium]|nr:CYCXC family (seleno)protein [Gemmatimonadales bacterium]
MKNRTPWVVAGVAALALGFLLLRPKTGHTVVHPEPRPGVTSDHVLPSGMVPHASQALEAYEAARRNPQLLDGLYCHCECSKYFGHRSLLTCFESNHGGNCDICMGEAILATQLAARGNSLAQIRQAIDAQFGS